MSRYSKFTVVYFKSNSINKITFHLLVNASANSFDKSTYVKVSIEKQKPIESQTTGDRGKVT